MFIDLTEKVKTSIGEIRGIFSYYKEASKEKTSANPHDFYRVDKWDARGYFGVLPKWNKKIENYFRELKKKRQKITYVDICGRASGRLLGADISFLFSFITSDLKRMGRHTGDVFIDGDLFQPTDFSKLLREVKKKRIAPAFITFMPMAGLQEYTPLGQIERLPNYEAVTYLMLGKRLEDLIRILRPGGYIMLERPFQLDGSMAEAFVRTPQNQFQFSLAVKKLVRRLKCRVEIVSSIGGPYFLIHKPILK